MSSRCLPPDAHDLSRLVSSAYNIIDQPSPPSLRDILGAYRQKGDGDRDMLLAMLNAKSAEDQRLANLAALNRTILETYHASSAAVSPPLPSMNGVPPSRHYPTPAFTQSPPLRERRPSRRDHSSHHPHQAAHHPYRPSSRSPSPRTYPHLPPVATHLPYPSQSHSEPPRKRHRPSHSPVDDHERERLPPSPYSSHSSASARSDLGPEYSPRHKGSMAIGSLLSAAGRGEDKTDRDPDHPDSLDREKSAPRRH